MQPIYGQTGQGFGNFEESFYQGMLFDTKT